MLILVLLYFNPDFKLKYKIKNYVITSLHIFCVHQILSFAHHTFLLSPIVHVLSLFYTPTPSSTIHATYHCFFVHQLHNVFANFKKTLIDTNLELSQQKIVDQGESM